MCVYFGSPARADGDDAPKPAPRTAVTIGGASVVLVAMGQQLFAFVDRVDDNTPISDAELSVQTDEGDDIPMAKAPLTLTKTTEGLFVGPLKRAGQMQGAFMVSLHSAAGSGDAPTEITYSDVTVAPVSMPVVGASASVRIGIAAVSGGIGVVATTLFMMWWQGGGRRRRTMRASGTGHRV